VLFRSAPPNARPSSAGPRLKQTHANRYPYCRACGQVEPCEFGHDDADPKTVGPYCKACGGDRMVAGHSADCEHNPRNRRPSWKPVRRPRHAQDDR